MQDFNLLILDDLVLQVAQMYRQDVLALPQDEDYNKGKRHAAYRQYILWHHGRLAPWCGGQPDYSQLLCLGNSGQVPRPVWTICGICTFSFRLKTYLLFVNIFVSYILKFVARLTLILSAVLLYVLLNNMVKYCIKMTSFENCYR